MQSKLEEEDNRYIKFYYGRFLASTDVKTMTTAEVGGYTLLLLNSIDQKERGYLPDNDTILRKIAGMGPIIWDKSKHKILKKFKKGDHGYYNEMMLKAIKDEISSASSLPDDNAALHPLQKYVSTFPRIRKLYEQQLTYKQCEMLLAQFSLPYIKEKVKKMENHKNVWPSVYLTIEIWCKNDLKK